MPLSEVISFGHIENQLMHPHRNAGMELVLVDHGHLEWAVEGRPEVLTPGSLFFTLPWQAHGSLYLREPKNRIYFVLFELAKSYAEPSATVRFPSRFGFTRDEERMLSGYFCGALQHAWPSTPAARQLFPALVRLLGSTSALSASGARAHLRSLLFELAGVIADQGRSVTGEPPTVKKTRHFLQRLSGRLDEPWTLARMAEACGVRRTQFAKLCQRLTGFTPILYLNRLRFEKACELLRETDRSVTDIAFQCGFSTSQYLSESFKKTALISPTDYRRLAPQLDAIQSAGWRHPEWRTLEEEHHRREILLSVDEGPWPTPGLGSGLTPEARAPRH